MLTTSAIRAFQQEILAWYEQQKRDLPWRKTRDPYSIWISEVMLQQTQVARVIPKYLAWREHFPTLNSLAQARTAEVLGAWSGLGYNRRALYLQKAAQQIITDYQGVFPQDERTLKALPGFGDYTARAVLCFAFDQQVAVVDTNIRKVIALRFFSGNPPDAKMLQATADKLLPQEKAYEWNQALMDYSAAVLKDKKVPVPKQSKFLGSNRYYRGQIIKLLLQQRMIEYEELMQQLHLSVQEKEKFDAMLKNLVAEGFLRQKGRMIMLA